MVHGTGCSREKRLDSEMHMQEYHHEEGFRLENAPRIWDLDTDRLFPSDFPLPSGTMGSSPTNGDFDYLRQPKLKSHCPRFTVSATMLWKNDLK